MIYDVVFRLQIQESRFYYFTYMPPSLTLRLLLSNVADAALKMICVDWLDSEEISPTQIWDLLQSDISDTVKIACIR